MSQADGFLEQNFLKQFARNPEKIVFAPGRVNLIGEHTDYNLGLVLPTPIRQQVQIAIAKRQDNSARLHALNQTKQYQIGAETAGQGWLDYAQAITQEFKRDGFLISGFDALVESDVPLGSGLSSSAALLVALARALRALFSLSIDDLEIALLAQRAENGLVGANVGLMDQMACSLGKNGEALFINFRNLKYQSVALPENIELVILHSGITHSHAHDTGTRNYKTRRAECEQAWGLLKIECLSDLNLEDLPRIEALPAPISKRAKHVVTENARVQAAVKAIANKDMSLLGQLFYQSHQSMTEDYDMSEPEIDLIIELAQKDPRIFGARLTGGGFGGSVVMLATPGTGALAGTEIAQEYAKQTGKTPKLLT